GRRLDPDRRNWRLRLRPCEEAGDEPWDERTTCHESPSDADFVEQREELHFEADAEVLDDHLHFAVDARRAGEVEVVEQVLALEADLDLALRAFELGAEDVADLGDDDVDAEREAEVALLVPLRSGAGVQYVADLRLDAERRLRFEAEHFDDRRRQLRRDRRQPDEARRRDARAAAAGQPVAVEDLLVVLAAELALLFAQRHLRADVADPARHPLGRGGGHVGDLLDHFHDLDDLVGLDLDLDLDVGLDRLAFAAAGVALVRSGRLAVGRRAELAVVAARAVVGHAVRAVALRALAALRRGAGGARVAAAVPPGLEDADAGIGANHRAVVAHRAGADRDERSDVVIERVHLGHFARAEAVDVGQRHRRRRIEHRAGRLDGDDEPRLLAEAG